MALSFVGNPGSENSTYKTTWPSMAGKVVLKKLYKLVSFNRKVIVTKKCGRGSIDCSPYTNYYHRFIFMALSLLLNIFMLYPVHYVLFSNLSYYHLDLYQLQAAHFSFVIVNCTLAFTFTKSRGYEYLGQVNMLALRDRISKVPRKQYHLF